jgi:hypothetical protein
MGCQGRELGLTVVANSFMAASSSGSLTLGAITKQGIAKAPSSVSSVDIMFLRHRPTVAEHGLERVETSAGAQHEDVEFLLRRAAERRARPRSCNESRWWVRTLVRTQSHDSFASKFRQIRGTTL